MTTLDKIKQQTGSGEPNAFFVYINPLTNEPIELMCMSIKNDTDLDFFMTEKQRNSKWKLKQLSYEDWLFLKNTLT